MNANVEHLMDEALALSPEERSAMALALLDSLPGEDSSVIEKAWADEIRRRLNALDSGAVRAIPWAEVRARLDSL
ncbi:MAG: hypothetical protein JWN73_514 [Betaproteobacteria bacterium]|nr:hypothetical protein [Betaproteobacteria bacterium]